MTRNGRDGKVAVPFFFRNGGRMMCDNCYEEEEKRRLEEIWEEKEELERMLEDECDIDYWFVQNHTEEIGRAHV